MQAYWYVELVAQYTPTPHLLLSLYIFPSFSSTSNQSPTLAAFEVRNQAGRTFENVVLKASSALSVMPWQALFSLYAVTTPPHTPHFRHTAAYVEDVDENEDGFISKEEIEGYLMDVNDEIMMKLHRLQKFVPESHPAMMEMIVDVALEAVDNYVKDESIALDSRGLTGEQFTKFVTGVEFRNFGTAVTVHFANVRQAHHEQDAHNDLKKEVQRAKETLARQMAQLSNRNINHGVVMPGEERSADVGRAGMSENQGVDVEETVEEVEREEREWDTEDKERDKKDAERKAKIAALQAQIAALG